MSGSSLFSIQQAIYDRLTSYAPLMNKVTGIFDFTIGNTEFPYITVGEAVANPYSTYNSFGQEVSITIHAWSRYLGYRQLDDIVNDIVNLLGNRVFFIDNKWGNVGSWFENTSIIVEPDGITRHAIMRFSLKVLSQQTCSIDDEE